MPSPSLAAQLPEAIRTAAHPQDSVKGQSLSLRLSNDTQSHQPLWSTAGAPELLVGSGAASQLCSPLPASAPRLAPGARTATHPFQRYRTTAQTPGAAGHAEHPVRKHLATRPEASSGSAAARLSGQGPFHCKLSWFGLQTRYSLPGRISVNYADMEAPLWKEGL